MSWGTAQLKPEGKQQGGADVRGCRHCGVGGTGIVRGAGMGGPCWSDVGDKLNKTY